MKDEYKQFEQRKKDHIELALLPANQTPELSNFDQVVLIHEALPDLNFADISITNYRFGQPTPTPFLVSSMTAGHKRANAINRNLLEACAKSGWAMGVGSQRRELTDNEAAAEWRGLRQDFPNVMLFSNIGLAQLLDISISQIRRLIDNVDADALVIHCNPLQEVIQPEGTPNFKGCWQALAQLIAQLTIPVIIKETGCGFSIATLKRLNELGVSAVDVSGIGGTHWGRIEGQRTCLNNIRHTTATTFKNWGIDTVQSVKNALVLTPNFEVWGSGGVRTGLDAAKLLALGATTIGFAQPLLAPALISAERVYEVMSGFEYELRVAMFCTGSQFVHELKEKYAYK